MTILSVDSSALPVSCALIDERMTAEFTVSISLTHSETLMPLIDCMLKKTGTELKSIDALAIAGGPGSFTGLRIGSATVKGLAEALDIPVISVPTLEALAYNIFGTEGLIVPMMDARRRNAYTAIYEYENDELKAVMEEAAMPLTELIDRLNSIGRKAVFTGDGIVPFREELEEKLTIPHSFAPVHLSLQRAGAVGALALKLYKEGKYTDAAAHRPDYLKASQAEREKSEAEKNGTLKELSAGGHALYV